MPNRILKESICTSGKINALSDFLFRVWACLITYVDDFGRGDARPAIIKGRCFPLRESITVTDIENGIAELAERGCIQIYEVDGEKYLCFPNWNNHQTIRNKKSKYPEPPSDDIGLKSIAINCNQLQSIASKCSRNPIQSESVSESLSESELPDDDAKKIQNDHNRVMDAAEDAGFKMSNDVRAALIALYADHGLQAVLDGLRSCSEHGAVTLAYLRAVLAGGKKEKKPVRVLPAQNFDQRDYTGVDSEIMDQLGREMREFQKTGEVS